MITVRDLGTRIVFDGIVTSIGGSEISGISILMSGDTRIDGVTMRRLPVLPGRIIVGSDCFSGVRLIVRVLRSRITVKDTSPSCFLLITRDRSPGELTFSPSIAVMTSPAFRPALAAGLFSFT